MYKTIATIFISVILGGLFGSYLTIFAFDRLPWSGGSGLETILQKTIVELNQESAVIDVVKNVSPSVVSIIIERDINAGASIDPFFEDFFPWPYYFRVPETDTEDREPNFQKVGGGTGFIISPDGYILTNKHVLSDPDARYRVVLNDDREFAAQIVGTDLFNDIGALKIEADNLPVVELGDSDSLVIGQTVIAIGNALAEFSNTVTTGVVSGMGRSIIASASSGASERLEDVIQTDAAINPGNSGGPLLNLAGQVVGVNTAISRSGQLIGFAIPINSVKSIILSLKESGEIVRPYLGVRYIMLNKEIASLNNLEFDYGALISPGRDSRELAVLPNSPAAKAGLAENDIILAINGQELNSDHHLAKVISSFMPGDSIELRVFSQGETKTIRVTLEKYNVQN